jgi:hypothetical protein
MDVILFGKEGTAKMRKKEGYILAAALGAIGGGAIVAIATKAIPKIMSGMMQNMMARMAKGGCNPSDI